MIHAHVEVEKNIKNVTENNLKKRKSEIRLMISDFFFVFNSFFSDTLDFTSTIIGILFVLIYILLMNFVVSNVVWFFGQELDRMMFLLIAAAILVLCLGYLIFHQNAKSIVGDYWETTTMSVLGILTVALSVIAVFWLVEGGLLAWTPYSIRGVY